MKNLLLFILTLFVAGCAFVDDNGENEHSWKDHRLSFVYSTRYNTELCVYHCYLPCDSLKPFGVAFKTNNIASVYEFQSIKEFKEFISSANAVIKQGNESGTFGLSGVQVNMILTRRSDDWTYEWEIKIGESCKFLTTDRMIEQVLVYFDP